MSLYYLILWNQVDILQKHLKKDHVHMRLWTRFYGTCESGDAPSKDKASDWGGGWWGQMPPPPKKKKINK